LQVKAAVIALWVTLLVPGIPLVAYEYRRSAALAPEAAVFILVFAVVLFTISAILTFFIGRGRNWSRIAYLLFLALSVLTLLGSFGEMLKSPAWVIAGNILNTLIDFAVLAALFFGPGGRWFGQMRE
jgi:hypothetical protein